MNKTFRILLCCILGFATEKHMTDFLSKYFVKRSGVNPKTFCNSTIFQPGQPNRFGYNMYFGKRSYQHNTVICVVNYIYCVESSKTL